MTSTRNIVALDVGNSAIKVALANLSDRAAGPIDLSSHGPVNSKSFPLANSDWCQRLGDWLEQCLADGPTSWWVSTVNRAASGPLMASLSARFDPASDRDDWRALGCDDIPIRAEVDHPERVGVDRLLSAYAAYRRFPAPLVVVDAGSAVTVDLVRVKEVEGDSAGQPVFAGGAIFPGIRLQHEALAAGTEGLEGTASQGREAPVFAGRELKSPGSVALSPATNTKQAIGLGVIATVTGGIERLADEYAADEYARANQPFNQNRGPQAKESLPVVLTGGDGSTISRFLRTKHVFVPNLVCSALLDLATRQCQTAPSGLE